MPMYEYHCPACGLHFEMLRGLREETAPACPSCDHPDTEKALSVPAVHTRPASPCGSGACGTATRQGGLPPCAGGGGCNIM